MCFCFVILLAEGEPNFQNLQFAFLPCWTFVKYVMLLLQKWEYILAHMGFLVEQPVMNVAEAANDLLLSCHLIVCLWLPFSLSMLTFLTSTFGSLGLFNLHQLIAFHSLKILLNNYSKSVKHLQNSEKSSFVLFFWLDNCNEAE